MKKWLIRIVGILVALVLVVGLIGLLTPVEHKVSRAVQIKQSPQAIWDAINDHAHEAQWRSDITSVDSLPARDGKPVWKETYKDGNTLNLVTTESRPPTRMVREIADAGPFSGRWEIDIQSNGAGSTVRITEIGRIPNPFFRFASKYIMGQTTQMERYLTNLAKKFGEPALFV